MSYREGKAEGPQAELDALAAAGHRKRVAAEADADETRLALRASEDRQLLRSTYRLPLLMRPGCILAMAISLGIWLLMSKTGRWPYAILTLAVAITVGIAMGSLGRARGKLAAERERAWAGSAPYGLTGYIELLSKLPIGGTYNGSNVSRVCRSVDVELRFMAHGEMPKKEWLEDLLAQVDPGTTVQSYDAEGCRVAIRSRMLDCDDDAYEARDWFHALSDNLLSRLHAVHPLGEVRVGGNW